MRWGDRDAEGCGVGWEDRKGSTNLCVVSLCGACRYDFFFSFFFFFVNKCTKPLSHTLDFLGCERDFHEIYVWHPLRPKSGRGDRYGV
jgi:hypothetical protein